MTSITRKSLLMRIHKKTNNCDFPKYLHLQQCTNNLSSFVECSFSSYSFITFTNISIQRLKLWVYTFWKENFLTDTAETHEKVHSKCLFFQFLSSLLFIIHIRINTQNRIMMEVWFTDNILSRRSYVTIIMAH